MMKKKKMMRMFMIVMIMMFMMVMKKLPGCGGMLCRKFPGSLRQSAALTQSLLYLHAS